MRRCICCLCLISQFIMISSSSYADGLKDRKYWLQEMDKMCRPIMEALANDQLREKMPHRTSKFVDNKEHRIQVQYVEVLGRVLSGISPWLAIDTGDDDERALRVLYRKWTIKGLQNALDSNARDFMRFDIGGQQLVDASFLSLAIIRSPWIWTNLDVNTKANFVKSIILTRKYLPVYSNWLLFSAVNEVFLAKFGYDWDAMRVDYALRQFEQWYVGDGMYKDGEFFAFDYYNSYVIHPYLAIIKDVLEEQRNGYKDMFSNISKRNARYAEIQERMINADGTFAPIGRSLTYRTGAFHHLADMGLRQKIPISLSAGQVRSALTAVIQVTLSNPNTYLDGWLTIGLNGYQEDIGDFYNNQGSPYLATAIFLPLGLPIDDDFWKEESQNWTAQKFWKQGVGVKDKSIH